MSINRSIHQVTEDMAEPLTGSSTPVQFLLAFLVSLAWLFDAQQAFIPIFADYQPPWHCTPRAQFNSTTSCNPTSSQICQLPQSAWAWDLPPHSSTISQWSLQCSNSFIRGLPASSFFSGCVLGGIFLSPLADTSLIGRKNLLIFTCLAMNLSALLIVLSTNIWVYSGFRFLCGFARSPVGSCSIVLASEMVENRWRGRVGVFGFLLFTLGFASLPAIAFPARGSSWKVLYLCTSVPGILYCVVVYFFVAESPRWIRMHSYEEQPCDRVERSSTKLKWCHQTFKGNLLEQAESNPSRTLLEEERQVRVDLLSSVKILLQKRWASWRLFKTMVIAFGVGIMYYGMPLGLGYLSIDLYVSVALNALMDLPSTLITFFFIDKWNRRSSLLPLTTTTSICSIMCAVVGERSRGLQLIFELMAFLCSSVAFAILLIYTLELFPTCVRNSAMSMVRQAVVLGGAVSPVLAAAGERNGFISYGVFGLVIGFSGIFVVCLPETRGSILSDTMEEQENKDGIASSILDGA